MLNDIDEFTHECLAIRINRKLKAIDVIDVLSDLFILRDAVISHPLVQKSRQATPREWKVMALATEGLSNKEIAHRLNMSKGTAKIHLHHIYRKIGVRNRTALATMAFQYSSAKQVDH